MGAALRNEDFPMTSGIQMRDWIYISDVVTAFVALLATDLSPGTTVELGSGKPVAVRDVIERLFRLVGGTGRPLPGKLEDRPGEVLHQCAKVKETAALIGWRPRVSLDEGLRRLLECELRST
jgi:CDP-paratose synthetase